MQFDKSRAYTSLNADELKQGDKVIVADTMQGLKYKVKANEGIDTLYSITDEGEEKRFLIRIDCINKASAATSWLLAYLVEREMNCTNCPKRGTRSCYHADKVSNTFCCEDYPKTKQKVERHTDYNHCEEAKKAYYCAMTNACPEKHYRPFKDTDELIKVWDAKCPNKRPVGMTMPLIWVRNKSDRRVWLINEFDNRILDYLFPNCEFLDGSPCGVKN